MSELKLEFVGKKVKDMYGTFVGGVVGIITDIEGSIESVSVDTGSNGLKNLPYEQLLVQGDYVIFIPRWRLDAQKLLREKSLTLKRLKALQEIVSDNDEMKDDAELVYLKYEKRLNELGENTDQIIERLHQRLSELDTEGKRIKAVLFDAKLQFKSNEVTEDIYQQISMHTNELIDHINLEKNEINNIMNKLKHQTLENTSVSRNEIKERNSIAEQNENKQEITTLAEIDQQSTSSSSTTDSDETEKEGISYNQGLLVEDIPNVRLEDQNTNTIEENREIDQPVVAANHYYNK